MKLLIKKIIFSLFFNFSLFSILIVGMQNSSYKGKVNFLFNETVNLPISFIIGASFISGSIFGGFIDMDFKK